MVWVGWQCRAAHITLRWPGQRERGKREEEKREDGKWDETGEEMRFSVRRSPLY